MLPTPLHPPDLRAGWIPLWRVCGQPAVKTAWKMELFRYPGNEAREHFIFSFRYVYVLDGCLGRGVSTQPFCARSARTSYQIFPWLLFPRPGSACAALCRFLDLLSSFWNKQRVGLSRNPHTSLASLCVSAVEQNKHKDCISMYPLHQVPSSVKWKCWQGNTGQLGHCLCPTWLADKRTGLPSLLVF